MADVASIIPELVSANHILVRHGIVDAFGHVSARHPDRADRFLLSRNRAPALISAEDILEFDLDGAPILSDHPPLYLERFIHAALYRTRADVGAVVHSHSPSVIPFGAARDACLRPVSHMAGFLGGGAPIYEIRDSVGTGSDLLIRDNALGDSLARAIGAAPVVLMRGHGATAVGRDIPQAVFHAIYTEWNARIQANTLALGSPIYLTPEEGVAAAAANDGQIYRAWEYWKIEVEHQNEQN
ncbi:MAG: class II aldolase/adducin family protein [Caulobacteraceae bacterium]